MATPPPLQSSPSQTRVNIIERTSSEANRPSRTRTDSESSLQSTIDFYGVKPNSPPRRRGSGEASTSTNIARPPSATPISPTTAHRASILPSPAFFNPKRVSNYSSPSIGGSSAPSASAVTSPSLQPSAFAQDPHARLRSNGPLITRIGSPSIPSPAPSYSGHGPLAPSSSAMARGGSNRSAGARSTASVSAGEMSDEDVEADLRMGGRRASRMRREGSAEGRSFGVMAAEVAAAGGPLHPNQKSDGSTMSGGLPPPIPSSSSRTQLRDPLRRNPSSTSNPRSYAPSHSHSRSQSFAPLPPSLAPEPPTSSPRVERPLPPPPATSIPPTVPITDSKGRKLRNYQLHPTLPSPSPGPRVGTKFLLGGRALNSKDNPWPMIASSALAVMVPILFLVFSSSWLAKEVDGGGAALAIWSYICLIMWSSMAKTALSDPGILPRALDETPERKWVEDLYEEGGEGDDGRGGWRAEPKWLRIGEGVVASKWCETCHTYRPPRTSHCRLCDNCVLGTDHHCTFLNNCIGRRNYTPFLSFLFSAVILSILSIALSAYHISDYSGNIGRWNVAGSIVVIILATALGVPIAGLAGYHVRLLWSNRTTIEMLRAKGDRSLSLNPSTGEPLSNPYKLSKPWANMASLACRPLEIESWLDPRAYAVRDAREVGAKGNAEKGV